MKALLRISLAALLLAGCNGMNDDDAEPMPAPNRDTVSSEQFEVTMTVGDQTVLAGEDIKVVLSITNKTEQPVEITANTGALTYVRVWRDTAVGWEQLRRYPQVTTMMMQPWTLGPGKTRTNVMRIPVEPNWPVAEPVRITGEWNGAADLRPAVTIHVVSDTEGG